MQVSTLLARKLVLDVLKLYVRFNAGHHPVWRAMHICRRDHSGNTMQGFILAPLPSDWRKDP